MIDFQGFPDGKLRVTPIPDLFYTEILPQVTDLAELKIILYMFWYLRRQSGYPRYMTLKELETEGTLLTAMGESLSMEERIEALRQAVDAAIVHGVLLEIHIDEGTEQTRYIMMNTALSRQAEREIKSGGLVLEREGHVLEPHIQRERPHIFELYEQNIGLLQPLLAEELQEAEEIYPTDWIEEAFRIAVENNARSWRYIRAVLERWQTRGKDDGKSTQR